MIRTTDIHSLSDFQRNAKTYIQQVKATKNPIAITVNGSAEVVVQDAAAYQEMLDRLEQAELVASLRTAMRDMDEGQGMSLDEFKREMDETYGV